MTATENFVVQIAEAFMDKGMDVKLACMHAVEIAQNGVTLAQCMSFF